MHKIQAQPEMDLNIKEGLSKIWQANVQLLQCCNSTLAYTNKYSIFACLLEMPPYYCAAI